MIARDVSQALARARKAGEALRARPADRVLDTLAAAVERLADPRSAIRTALADELPEATGFSPETVREGLNRALGAWSGDALRDLVERELGRDAFQGKGPRAVGGFATTAAILAGALPMPTLLDLLAPLVLRSPVVAKPSQHDPVTAVRFQRDLADADPELGAAIEIVAFPGDDADCVAALVEADCVLVTGSDATVGEVSACVAPPRRVVRHGHKLSIAAVGPHAESDVAARIAQDVALWDQLGCLSPVAVYAVGGVELAEALADALAEAEARCPRGRVPPEAANAAVSEADQAHMRGARVWGDSAGRFTVVREADTHWRPAPLHRFVRVHPVPDIASLVDALRPLGPFLAGAALEGFGPATRELSLACAGLGASRICAPGRMQEPPLSWCRGNRGVLTPLARFTDLD
jgi:acyl-CoA reductase-like NAD-dependent aldehyde dehydrogenase